MNYLAVKALHFICVISWFAGMFYIFRLFVYHTENWGRDSVPGVLLIMESKLIRLIIFPAALGTLATGAALFVMNPALLSERWIWTKLFFVGILIFYSVYSYRVHKSFAQGRRVLSGRACRLINEVPTLALVAIGFLVFLKPWGAH